MASQAVTRTSISLVQTRAGSSVGRSSAVSVARPAACHGHRAAHLGSSSALRTTSMKAWQPTQRAQSLEIFMVKADAASEADAAHEAWVKNPNAETLRLKKKTLTVAAKEKYPGQEFAHYWDSAELGPADGESAEQYTGAYRPKREKRGYNNDAAAEEDEDEDPPGPDGYWENMIQVRRVTKVAKGGKNMSFRAVVVIGDKNGTVGVGCGKAKEVVGAVEKARIAAQKNCIKIDLTGGEASTFQHKHTQKYSGALVMLRPAANGTGVIAGGACKSVLELAGVKNGFAKQYGSANQLNNAMAVLEGLRSMRSLEQVAKQRGISVKELYH